MLLTSPLSSPLKNPVRDVFSPAASSQSLTAQVQALFAGGKVGGMWELGDTSTLYQQHSAGGTTFDAVTAVGQEVGMAIDKSKQSTWTDNTGSTWAKSSGDGVVTVVGNVITITGATTTTRVDRVGGTIQFIPGVAVFDVTAAWSTATGPFVWCRGAPQIPPNGTAQKIISNLNGSTLERVQIDTGTATFTINSLKYWKGNHATQPTAINRPLYQVDGGYGCAQFDAVNDALLFPAITFGGAFNTFVSSKVTGSPGLHLWRTADSPNGFWAAYANGDVGSPTPTVSGVGSPSYAINGVALSPVTRGQLYSQINGVASVVETTGIVLSAETALQMAGYGGFQFQGNAHRVLMISGTLTAGEKLLCRQWAAQGNGVTVV